MGFLDRLLGREEADDRRPVAPHNRYGTQPLGTARGGQTPPSVSDEQALARYRYMLQTAPPEALEQAHEEAFTKLTPEQRRMALEQLSQATPENERSSLGDDPRSLARAATRAEMRQPGTMERTFGGGGGMMGGMGGIGMGGLMAGSILTSIAGGFIGSAIANSFFNNPAVAQDYAQSDAAQAAGDNGTSAMGGDPYGDPAGGGDPYGDPAGGDPYGDPADAGGDFGGDFGGGDFGGDFGGGDF